MTSKAESYLNSAIEDALRFKKQAQAIGAFLKTGRAKRFVDTAVAMEGEWVRSYVFSSNSNLYIQLYVKDLSGFKDQRLAGILSTLEYLNPDQTEMVENAGQMSKNFHYTYEQPRDEVNNVRVLVHINVEATIVSDSETCQRVMVGMTTPQPQPIYKLVCDGEENPLDPVAMAREEGAV